MEVTGSRSLPAAAVSAARRRRAAAQPRDGLEGDGVGRRRLVAAHHVRPVRQVRVQGVGVDGVGVERVLGPGIGGRAFVLLVI